MAENTRDINRQQFLKLTAAGVVSFSAWASISAFAPGLRSGVGQVPAGAQVERRPNILFIVTDDQILATLEYMPKTRELLQRKGMTFERAYAADPVCAPARASILTGKHVRNHGVKYNLGTDRAMRKVESNALPLRLKRAGYQTGMFGKYNTDSRTTSLRVPPGWDSFNATVAPFNYREDMRFNRNGKKRRISVGKGSDCSVIARMAKDFISGAEKDRKPWFCYIATHSPHGPYFPSEKHEKDFRNEVLPKLPNYNEKNVSDKPRRFQKVYQNISSRDQRQILQEWRGTLREVRDVDDMVENLVDFLGRNGVLDNTFVVFLTDNAYPYGHNRAWGGKGWPYSSMTRLPFIVRGPGVSRGIRSEALVSQVDLLSTCMEACGGDHEDTDGRPLQPILSTGKAPQGEWRNRLLISHYMRQKWHASVERDRLYVEHSTGEKELYDLGRDPHETNSLHESESKETLAKLSARLNDMQTSTGQSYRKSEM